MAAQCALLGQRVYYVPDALTYDEEPVSFTTSMRQRRRWSAGVQSVANQYTGKLVKKRPSWLRWDLACHINMIYVQLLAFLPILYGFLNLPISKIVMSLGISFLSFWLGTTVMGFFLSVTARRNPLKQWRAVTLYPLFLASWYPLHIWALFAKPKQWTPIAHGKSSVRHNVFGLSSHK